MIETRQVEARYEQAGNKLVGYAAVFDAPTEITERGRTFTETVSRGAFSRALAERQDVIAVVNHDENRLLGRTASGTLKLSEDAIGLRFEIDLPSSEAGIGELVQRGDLRGASFAFETVRDNWPARDRRQLQDVNLRDVSVVVHPAYPQTSVNARQRNARLRLELRRKLMVSDR